MTMRNATRGVLPKKAALEREFLAGASYAQLAAKYGCSSWRTVMTTMKRRALREGTQWPLKQGTYQHRQRLSRVCSETRWDGITAMMIKAEINEAVETLGVSKQDIIRLSGVGDRTVYEVSSGVRDRISRVNAEKIMKAITELERRKAHGAKMRQWHAARRTLSEASGIPA